MICRLNDTTILKYYILNMLCIVSIRGGWLSFKCCNTIPVRCPRVACGVDFVSCL